MNVEAPKPQGAPGPQAEPATLTQQLHQLLDRSCELCEKFMQAVDGLRAASSQTDAARTPVVQMETGCLDSAALVIAERMFAFSAMGDIDIDRTSYPYSARLSHPHSEHSNGGLIIDKTRRFVRDLSDKMAREPFSSSWQLRVDYPKEGGRPDEALFAARIACAILESDFIRVHLTASCKEQNWRNGGHLEIIVDSHMTASTPAATRPES